MKQTVDIPGFEGMKIRHFKLDGPLSFSIADNTTAHEGLFYPTITVAGHVLNRIVRFNFKSVVLAGIPSSSLELDIADTLHNKDTISFLEEISACLKRQKKARLKDRAQLLLQKVHQRLRQKKNQKKS